MITSEEKMLEAAQAVVDAWNGGEVSWMMMCFEVIENLEAALKFVNTNSESEAGAFGTVVTFEDGSNVFRKNGEPFPPTAKGYIATEVYAAPPSAQAIETAVIMRAAEAVACPGRTIFDTEKAILALIPQDGYTHLQDLMMQGAASAWLEGELCGRGNKPYSADPIIAIVTNLIGDPPLNSETVSGEKK